MNNDAGIKQTAEKNDHSAAVLTESNAVADTSKKRSVLYAIALGIILAITIIQMSELLKILDALKRMNIGA